LPTLAIYFRPCGHVNHREKRLSLSPPEIAPPWAGKGAQITLKAGGWRDVNVKYFSYPYGKDISQEPALVLEEDPQHLGDGEDNLTVRHVQEKRLPHPFTLEVAGAGPFFQIRFLPNNRLQV